MYQIKEKNVSIHPRKMCNFLHFQMKCLPYILEICFFKRQSWREKCYKPTVRNKKIYTAYDGQKNGCDKGKNKTRISTYIHCFILFKFKRLSSLVFKWFLQKE